MASINNMVKKCEGLVDTKDITDWENTFLKSVIERSQNGKDTSKLSERQVSALINIYNKHFE